MVNSWNTNLYRGVTKDKRLDKRLEIIADDMLTSGCATMNKVNRKHSNKIASYRALNNKRLNHMDILSGSFNKCAKNIDVKHVLCLQDTTEFNFNSIKDKLGKDDPDIGPTTNKKIAGFFCHPTLVCEPSGSKIYGLSSAKIYNRKWDTADKYERDYKKLPIEQKESFRWIESAEKSRLTIPDNINITMVGDRESDIYEEFARVPNNTTQLLVRARINRRIEGEIDQLYPKLAAQKLATTVNVCLSGNKSRDKRTATIEVRFCEVTIKAPSNKQNEIKYKTMYAIEAKEILTSLAKGESPVHWRLLTTHSILTAEQAVECIDWYKQRWLIEELFRVIKTKGFRIESNQLGSGAAIKKLLSITLETALQVMRIKRALSEPKHQKASLGFNQKELDFFKLLLPTVEGKTKKQQNPYPPNTMQWTAWIIARLGAWSGYKSHGPPGYITIKNGYELFLSQFQIYLQIFK